MYNGHRVVSLGENSDWLADLASVLSDSQIAAKWGVPRSSVWTRRSRSRKEETQVVPEPRFDASTFPTPIPGFYDGDAKKFFDWIGKTQDYVTPRDGKGTTENWLIMSDLHVPDHAEDKIIQTCEAFLAEYGDGNLCLGGDLMDGYSLGSYGKSKESSMRHEMAVARKLLEYFASKFNKVILIDDNHVSGRFERWISKQVPPDLHFLVTRPYTYLCQGLPNVEYARRTYKNGMVLGWLVQIGDLVVTHAETHSGIPMRPVNKVSDWLDLWGDTLGLNPVRVVAQCHVHKLGSYFLPGKDRLIMETGCMAAWGAVGYSVGADLKYKPITRGAIFLSQVNGKTDFNRTRLVYLED